MLFLKKSWCYRSELPINAPECAQASQNAPCSFSSRSLSLPPSSAALLPNCLKQEGDAVEHTGAGKRAAAWQRPAAMTSLDNLHPPLTSRGHPCWPLRCWTPTRYPLPWTAGEVAASAAPGPGSRPARGRLSGSVPVQVAPLRTRHRIGPHLGSRPTRCLCIAPDHPACDMAHAGQACMTETKRCPGDGYCFLLAWSIWRCQATLQTAVGDTNLQLTPDCQHSAPAGCCAPDTALCCARTAQRGGVAVVAGRGEERAV